MSNMKGTVTLQVSQSRFLQCLADDGRVLADNHRNHIASQVVEKVIRGRASRGKKPMRHKQYVQQPRHQNRPPHNSDLHAPCARDVRKIVTNAQEQIRYLKKRKIEFRISLY